jgi:hypothetical protein
MTIEGRRPLLVEVQALVSRGTSANPRRAAQGVDSGRVAQLIAVLERHAGVVLGGADVFVSAVGGVRLPEPAADLGIALALVSATTDHAIAGDLAAVGEIGLGGELRQVPHAARRLAEAARMGFRRALVPTSSPPGPAGLELLRVGPVAAAIVALGIAPAGALAGAEWASGEPSEWSSRAGAPAGWVSRAGAPAGGASGARGSQEAISTAAGDRERVLRSPTPDWGAARSEAAR